MDLTFLGAAGTVTGSKFLLHDNDERHLIDCGIFQGLKELRLRNWAPLPVDPASISSVTLTHAHIDHSGYVPLLIRNGFRGQVYSTPATHELCSILLPDSGRLHEEEAEYANKKGFSKHHPALPLYTEADAFESLRYFRKIPFNSEFDLSPTVRAKFLFAGHILGSSHVLIRYNNHTVLFSGDLGRKQDLVLKPSHGPEACDFLVIESTYGDRLHDPADPKEYLHGICQETFASGGSLLIPAFAVGRTQSLLYLLSLLKHENRLNVPVFLDSPMAVDATHIFFSFAAEHQLTEVECERMASAVKLVRTRAESESLNMLKGPSVIISASGMATGGRVLHHLKRMLPDPKNTVLLSGYQAAGTRGATLQSGESTVKIHGTQVPVHAKIRTFDSLSAHADQNEILDWMKRLPRPPRMTYIVHGEPKQSLALEKKIREELGWPTRIPTLLESLTLP